MLLSLKLVAKSEELKNEIMILSQMFERVVDRKEAILKASAPCSQRSYQQSLVAYLGESEQQDYMSARTHMRNVDTLIGVQEQRVAQVCIEGFVQAHGSASL
jgi:hypothetical protein